MKIVKWGVVWYGLIFFGSLRRKTICAKWKSNWKMWMNDASVSFHEDLRSKQRVTTWIAWPSFSGIFRRVVLITCNLILCWWVHRSQVHRLSVVWVKFGLTMNLGACPGIAIIVDGFKYINTVRQAYSRNTNIMKTIIWIADVSFIFVIWGLVRKLRYNGWFLVQCVRQ